MPTAPERVHGAGWTGDEALAIGVYAAGAAGSSEDAVGFAANHDGDSNSTASIAGQLYGVRHGIMALPHPWVRRLDVLQDALGVTQKFLATQALVLDNAATAGGMARRG